LPRRGILLRKVHFLDIAKCGKKFYSIAMQTFKNLLLFWALSFSLLASSARAEVWADVNTWSPEWETQFAAWVQANWGADFFARPTQANGQKNPYYGMRVDCADTVYSMRLIFSYEHGLPFAMQDATSNSGIITNHMSRFDKYADPQERFRRFLLAMFDVVSTHSLPNDTFPVPISAEWIHSGSLIRTTEVNHHSWTIQEILPIGVPHLVYNSTVGRTSGFTLQQRTSWPNPGWVFEGNFSPSSNAGLRYWRPVDFVGKPVWQVPNYSEEQFKIPLKVWNKTVQKKLAHREETDEQLLRRLQKNACEGMVSRVETIQEGVTFLRSYPNQCMDAATYDTYSTPSRDQRVFDDVVALRRAYKEILRDSRAVSLPDDLKAQLSKIFPDIGQSARTEVSRMKPSELNAASYCIIDYGGGKKIDLAEAKRRIFAGLLSNNPLDELKYRWGELRGPSPRAAACPSWDVWTPDLKQAD
jgi:hypothetical protein